MGRDHTKLQVFHLPDELVVEVYKSTRGFPVEERFGLQSQLRRAAVSVAANIVEGCTRDSRRDYLHFMSIALGSASEVRYLVDLAQRLDIVQKAVSDDVSPKYDRLVRSLQMLIFRVRKNA